MSDGSELAPCGIDCTACDIYIAAHDPLAAERLADAWRAGGHADAKPEWFRCQGCRGDRNLRWKEDCKLAKCCEEKGLRNCSQCADFACEIYEQWVGNWAHHQAAYERLRAMRDHR